MHKKEIEDYEEENPGLKSDRAAADFVDKADLSGEELYDAVRRRAVRAGLPYQRFIRLTLEKAVASPK